MADLTDADWGSLISEFMTTWTPEGTARQWIEKLAPDPMAVTEGVDPQTALEARSETTRFLLFLVEHALGDHALTEAEVDVLLHVRRVLGIGDGEVLADWRGHAAVLVLQEMQRLLNDQAIDPDEALHKVKLQTVLGLSYDDMLELARPAVEKAIARLVRRADKGDVEGYSDRLADLRRQLLALDTVYRSSIEDEGGHIYVMVNPAMPDIVKVGRTNRTPEDRVTELTGASGVPTPFVLLYSAAVPDSRAAEAAIHAQLDARGVRTSPNREFFSISPEEAVLAILDFQKRGWT